MNAGKFTIYDIRVNELKEPLGLDEKTPVFSWKLRSKKQGTMQTRAQILVAAAPPKGKASGVEEPPLGEALFWDSGILATDCSIGIPYGGKTLLPESRYRVALRVWNQDGELAEGTTAFETGLLNPHSSAWEGAKWIGAPEFAVAADTLSVFVLESVICVEKGDRAGVIFGANDRRLLEKSKNEMGLAGESEIRVVLNVGAVPAAVEIYRAGYDQSDRPDIPLYQLPAKDFVTGENLITEENRRKPHKLTLQVVGNGVYTWLDDRKIDECVQPSMFGPRKMPRQLNPLGATDVTTYPRLCEIGYYVGEGSQAFFDGIRVRNLHHPGRELFGLDTETGLRLSGECRRVQDPSRHGLPMLRRDFTVEGEVASARLYATARGIYECSLNGQRLGDAYFAPGASQFDRHLLYQTYDVTQNLRPGKNGVGCILASGWWSDSFSFRLENCNYWGDKPSFLAKLVIVYKDGRRDVIVTDDASWEYYGEGPYRYAGFFNGEQFDARKSRMLADFSKAGFAIAGMKRPELITPVFMEETEGIFPGAACWPARNAGEPELVGNYQAPVREVEVLPAKSVTEPLPGVYIYDLEQEIAGVPRLRLRGRKGQRITIRYGEMLYPDLAEYGELCGQMLQANLREASNTDIYICSGEGEELYQPRFTFHGFRYIEISGVDAPPALTDVQGVLLSSVEEVTGSFVSSHPLLNRFVTNVTYSQYCNFISIPTDCPQRNERMGWLGDTHIFCRTAAYQSHVKNFYLRNLQAMKDMQSADGRLPSIAPFGGGFGGLTYESAMILMVWELYQQYGDHSIVEAYYDSMARWMEAMKKAGMPGMPEVSSPAWLGDWLAPAPADDYLLWNAFHYRNACLLEQMASLTGRAADAAKYRGEAERTKAYWNETFVEKETGRTKRADGSLCDVQGSYSIGLSCGVFAPEYEEKAFAHLARVTEEAGCTVQAGFFGTGPINPMLSKGGYPDLARKTMLQTACPSWLYPVTQGATTIWERWDSFTREKGFGGNNSMNSFNHYSLGSVLSWLYENVLGIRRDEEKPGFKHFTLKPEMGDLSFAKGGIETPHGRIESAWEETPEGYRYTCTVPENTTATLILNGESKELGSGRYEFAVVE